MERIKGSFSKAAQLGGVFVIDILAFVRAELADLAALAAVGASGSRFTIKRGIGSPDPGLHAVYVDRQGIRKPLHFGDVTCPVERLLRAVPYPCWL